MTLQTAVHPTRPVPAARDTKPQVEVLARPVTASEVELIGELRGSGYADRQWLVRRGDRFIQISELLYRVAEHANGEKTLADIAGQLTQSTAWLVGPDEVRHIIATKLIPLGIIDSGQSVQKPRGSSLSPLGVNARIKVIGPSIIEPIAGLLQPLFMPVVVILMLIASVVVHAWVYTVHGISSSLQEVVYTPWLILLQVVLVCASSTLHEFGHAAALRYSGGEVRGMGVGFYLVYPAFYTDVTDSYRLSRWSRVRTDLGGVYFNLLFVLATVAAYVATGQDFLLLTVVLVDLDLVRQLLPIGRLDGYWVLTDLTGVPDALSQLLQSARTVAARVSGSAAGAPRLKGWVSLILLIYALAIVPLLALLFLLSAAGLPTFLLLAWNSFAMQIQTLFGAISEQDAISMLGAAGQMGILAVTVLGPLIVLSTMAAGFTRGLFAWSAGHRVRQTTAVLGCAGALALLATQWAPQLPRGRPAEPENAPPGVQMFDVGQRLHVQSRVTYPQSPPVGGNHAPAWLNCGFYSTPVPNENAVHSLEHGAVWITYRPDLPDAEVQSLHDMAVQPHSDVIVSPYADLDAPLIATAWGRQLQLASANDPRLRLFVQAYRHGPQAPERGGPCSGGVGQPQP